ncbi:hypothetical protein CLOM_g7527 [Closterium sp. NIES-68]|nr:hypothetical protein CLOM_g7527 [Closterium sp. NIES-68]
MGIATLDLRPGAGLGPFSLGMALCDALAEVETQLGVFDSIVVNYCQQEPLARDIVIAFPHSASASASTRTCRWGAPAPHRRGGHLSPAPQIRGLAARRAHAGAHIRPRLLRAGPHLSRRLQHRSLLLHACLPGHGAALPHPRPPPPLLPAALAGPPHAAARRLGAAPLTGGAAPTGEPPLPAHDRACAAGVARDGDGVMADAAAQGQREGGDGGGGQARPSLFSHGGQRIAFGDSAQDVCYYTRGLDIIFSGQGYEVSKFVLHTNLPGQPDFNDYVKCNFRIRATRTAAAPALPDPSLLVTPDSKWGHVQTLFGGGGGWPYRLREPCTGPLAPPLCTVSATLRLRC